MTAPERYAFGYNGGLAWDLHPDHQGEWVSYSDYAILAAEKERLERERDELAAALDSEHDEEGK